MQGVIHGGWGYVWSAYGVTWVALLLYAISLWRRSAVPGGDRHSEEKR